MKIVKKIIILLVCAAALLGCGKAEDHNQRKKIDYTVTAEEKLPDELKNLIDQKKQEPFKMTYQDGGYLYICQGYGTQPTGGYSIQVKDVYRTDNAIYFASTLVGPSEEELQTGGESHPYIVIKMEYQELTVVFDS